MSEPIHNRGNTRESTMIRGDGVDLACFADGPAHAPVLVFVHGYPDNHAVWDRLVEPLVSEFRCVRYDVRGAGASGKPHRTRAYDLAHLEADLAAVIDWASPNAPVHLIAHDWGSIQSWEAVTDPALASRIASFTSISGPCLDHVGHWLRDQWRHDRAGLLRQIRKSWYIAAFHLPVLPALAWHTWLARRWPTIAARFEGQTLPANANQARDGAIGIRLYRANVARRLASPRKRHAQAPVQVITPTRDPFVGPDFTRGLSRWVDSLTVNRIDAGHWVIQTNPETVAARCREFVRRYTTPQQSNTTRTTARKRVSRRRANAQEAI